MTVSYGEWHTLTAEFDGEDEHGKPILDWELEHGPSCGPEPEIGPDGYPVGWGCRCYLESLLGEFEDFWPTEPGTYRVRAWSTPASWYGPHVQDADSGVEYDEGDSGVVVGPVG